MPTIIEWQDTLTIIVDKIDNSLRIHTSRCQLLRIAEITEKILHRLRLNNRIISALRNLQNGSVLNSAKIGQIIQKNYFLNAF